MIENVIYIMLRRRDDFHISKEVYGLMIRYVVRVGLQ